MSTESENAVIGAMLINPNIVDDIIEILVDEDFYNLKNRLIYRAICAVRNEGKSIDALTVAESMTKEQLNEAGGILHISELAKSTPSASNAVSYARVVKNDSLTRTLTAKLHDCIILASESTSYDELVSQINSKLSFMTTTDDKEVVDFDVILKQRLQDLDSRCQSDDKIHGMSTGWRDMDNLLMGISPGDFWVVGARPSMGKTVYMLNVCEHRVKQGDTVLCFSVEMTREDIVDRMLIASSGINSKRFKVGDLQDDDWSKLTAGVVQMQGNNRMIVVDKPAIDIGHLMAITRKIARKRKIDFICIDYLTIITAKGHKSKLEEISYISRSLKALAKEIGCPLMCLAQLSRGVESRPDKRPNNSDLRDSGQIEQDADIIQFLYRDEVYNEDSPNRGIMEVLTTKRRNGEIGKTYLQSDLAHYRFRDLSPDFRLQDEVKNTYKPYSG